MLPGALLEVKGDWKQLECTPASPFQGGCPQGTNPYVGGALPPRTLSRQEAGVGSSFLDEECRLDHWQALRRILEQGGELSPIWGVPWMSMQALRIDWLHVADPGITPVFLGGLFHLLLCDGTLGA